MAGPELAAGQELAAGLGLAAGHGLAAAATTAAREEGVALFCCCFASQLGCSAGAWPGMTGTRRLRKWLFRRKTWPDDVFTKESRLGPTFTRTPGVAQSMVTGCWITTC